MKNYSIAVLWITISCFMSKAAYGNPVLDKYFLALKQLDYESAKNHAVKLSDSMLKKEALQLTNVLFYAGQKDIQLRNWANNNHKTAYAIGKLAQGYHILYTNPYTSTPYKNFNEAYALAKETNYIPLIKFSLLSILRIYDVEMLKLSEDEDQYLEKFNALISDPADEYHYKMYLLRFDLQNIFRNVTTDHNFFDSVDALMNNFDATHHFRPNYYCSKGIFYKHLKQYDEAEQLLKKALECIRDEPFFKSIAFRANLQLSEIMRRQQQHTEAFAYIENAKKHINLADTTRSRYKINIYSSLNFADLGDYKNAYHYFEKAEKLRIQLEYRANSEKIADLNVQYQTKERELNLLKEQQKNRRNINLLIGAAGLLVLGSVVALLLHKNTTKKRKIAEQQQQLEKQKVETLMKEQELVSIDAMIAGQEKERQRVAHELHDDLGSLMAAIKLHSDNINTNKEDPALKNTHKLLDQAYQKIRSISHTKNSGVMAAQGLLSAIQKMANTISATNTLAIEVLDFGLEDRMENSLELTVFRIIQELITNVVKHAEATKASIQLTQHEDSINIIIEDNGKGFDVSTMKTSEGMGLNSIEKRVEHLEGNFSIESIKNRGTTIIIDIPT